MTLAVNIAQGGSNNVTMRNRIINGNFLINQRNGTNAVTTSSLQTNIYFSDRWFYYVDVINKMSLTQSTDAPAGFASSNLVTVLATDSVGPEQMVRQYIEGYNIADLGWGTSNAKACTLSFWVKSSVTGSFGGSLQSQNTGVSYPFLYTINSANTWEQKTVSVAGPTTGTFGTTNNIGFVVSFEFGPGYQAATANAWIAQNSTTATGASNFCSNAGATLRFTGVQLEAGTTASPFEYRQYGTELVLCQRYYQQIGPSTYGYVNLTTVAYESTTTVWGPVYLKTTMRSLPAFTLSGTLNVIAGTVSSVVLDTNQSNTQVVTIGAGGTAASSTTGYASWFRWSNTPSGYVSFSAEL
jgi:hypothetical protein